MRSASNGLFVDTNVLVHIYDPRDRVKQERAVEVFDRLAAAQRAVVSVQCLTEFFSSATMRLPEPMSRSDAVTRVVRLAEVCTVLDLTPAGVVEGCQAVVRHQLSIWDALIWAVARLNNVRYILTDDSEHGREIEGVTYLNPFTHPFDLDALGV
jgi:predicted nucleic acid-binding protein